MIKNIAWTKLATSIPLNLLTLFNTKAVNPINIKNKIIVLISCPGSGKGTFSELYKKYGYTVLSSGDLLRAEVKQNTPKGLEARTFMEQGKPVPANIMDEIVGSKLRQLLPTQKRLILDGYPQTLEQYQLIKNIANQNKLNNQIVFLSFNAPYRTCVKRMATRTICSNCTKIYNEESLKEAQKNICDVCTGSITKRKDDNPQTAQIRIDHYIKSIKPLLDIVNKEFKLYYIETGTKNVEECNIFYTSLIQ